MQLADLLEDENSRRPEDILFDEFEKESLQELLGAIDEREARVLTYRYGLYDHEPMTLKQIGDELGLTRERVRQIENEALKRLNAIMTR